MASINGITVKGMKKFRGHEGEPLYQGNIYIGKKKIGWWSQDAHGGCDNIYLDEPYKIRKLEAKVKELNRDKKEAFTRNDGGTYTIDYSLDIMFGDFVNLVEDEKMFKSAVKNGFSGLLLVTDGYHVFGWNLSKETTKMHKGAILTQFSKAIEECKEKNGFFHEDQFYKHKVKIYRSLDDFNIGTHIKLEDVMEDK